MTERERKLFAILSIAKDRETKALILQSYIQQYGPISETLKNLIDWGGEENDRI